MVTAPKATNRRVTITVNGEETSHEVEPRLLLVHYLRDVLGLTGTHIGCDTSQCGACTIHLDGVAVKSCTMFAVQADGREIRTIEGMAQEGDLHPLQEGFWEEHGLQCGYCTPGMIMTAADLLQRNANPSEAEIRHALKGNLCRCTGYEHIVNAIQYAAKKTGAPVDAEREPVPARTHAEVDRAAQLAGAGGQGGIPRPDELDEYYDEIQRLYPAIGREDLESAKAHPDGHLEGVVQTLRERSGDAVEAIRDRLSGLLQRR